MKNSYDNNYENNYEHNYENNYENNYKIISTKTTCLGNPLAKKTEEVSSVL